MTEDQHVLEDDISIHECDECGRFSLLFVGLAEVENYDQLKQLIPKITQGLKLIDECKKQLTIWNNTENDWHNDMDEAGDWIHQILHKAGVST